MVFERNIAAKFFYQIVVENLTRGFEKVLSVTSEFVIESWWSRLDSMLPPYVGVHSQSSQLDSVMFNRLTGKIRKIVKMTWSLNTGAVCEYVF